MKERGIIMAAESVRAILAGRKTQTRRCVKPMSKWASAYPICRPDLMAQPWDIWWHGAETERVGVNQTCPYGVPGDRLWVREGFYIDRMPLDKGRLPKQMPSYDGWRESAYYRADGECCQQIPECACAEVGPVPWRNPMFMPRWASRLTLEVVAVRVERVQEISVEDAEAETDNLHRTDCRISPARYDEDGVCVEPQACSCGDYTYRECFGNLWNRINGKRPGCAWSDNPWVWVVEFRKVEA